MAEKEEMGSVEEIATETMMAEEVTKMKRIRCIVFTVAFTLFQTGIFLLIIFFVLRFKTPKFRLKSASFDNFEINASSDVTASYFNFTINTGFGVKNTNYGHFKYEISNGTFGYRGLIVGVVSVDKARARADLRGNFMPIKVVLKSGKTNVLPTAFALDVTSGKLPITSSSKLNGKIELMELIKKKKSALMNCNMNIDIKTRSLQDIFCN